MKTMARTRSAECATESHACLVSVRSASVREAFFSCCCVSRADPEWLSLQAMAELHASLASVRSLPPPSELAYRLTS